MLVLSHAEITTPRFVQRAELWKRWKISLRERKSMAKTTCYQCGTEIEVEDITQVHPLCEDCQYDFDSWLQNEMICL